MKSKDAYTEQRFLSSRQMTFDIGKLGKAKHHIQALIELDVTDSRRKIKKFRAAQGVGLSFTAWLIKCIGQAVSEYPAVHSIRKGKNRLILFDDVDISIVVEKDFVGEKVPIPAVLRRVNERSAADIHSEIRGYQQQTSRDEGDYVMGEKQNKLLIKVFTALPQWIRLIVWRIILGNPFRMKRMMGTVVVTSVGMMGNVKGWVIPTATHPLCFATGSIVKKPGTVGNGIALREMLSMTILIDHDVIDGAPAARFVSRLTELIENGFGLPEIEK